MPSTILSSIPVAVHALSSSRHHICPAHVQQRKKMKSSPSFGLATAAAAIFLLASTAVVNAACSTKSNVITTFYGYPDNDPPGPATAYNCGGRNNIAGGEYIFSFPPYIDYLFSQQRPKTKMLNTIFFENRYWNLCQPSYVCQCSWRVHLMRNHLFSLFEKIPPFRRFLRPVQ